MIFEVRVLKHKFKKIILLIVTILIVNSLLPISGGGLNVFAASTIDKKELIVGLSAEYAPYEFHAMIDGKDTISGFDVEIAKEIAKDMNCKLVIKEMEFKSLISALKAGQIDMIISGMNPTPEREKEVDFSEIYYEARHGVLIREKDKEKYTELSDLYGDKVGLQLGSTQQEVGEALVKDGDFKLLANINNLILELKTGKVNSVITEKPVAQMAIATNKELTLSDIDINDGITGTAVAVKKDSTELLESINTTIKRLKDENRIEELVEEASILAAENQSESEENFIVRYSSVFLKGLETTLIISLVTVFFGTILGATLFFMKSSKFFILKMISSIYIEVIRGTPMLLQVMLAYTGSKMVLNLDLSAFSAAIIAISLNSAAYISEIVRAGIESVDKGQMEAARSLGMSKALSMKLIIIPQAIKSIIPAIGNEFVTIIKESSIASVIGVTELMFAASIVTGSTYKAIEPLMVSAVLYFVLTFTLGRIMGYFERRMKSFD